MILYRMSKIRHARDLSGKGAQLAGGRWNKKGLPALYLAENRSLSILEAIVHCHSINDLNNRVILSIEVNDNLIDVFNTKKLPNNWNSFPWNNFTINEGSKWLKSLNNLSLQIPSAIIPEEINYIVNPRHPEFNKVKIVDKQVFRPDQRLLLI